MATGAANPLIPGSGHLVDAVLAEDLANLRSWLALQGFFEAEVGEPEIREGEERRLTVVVPIHEGPRRRIVDLEISGVEALDLDQLRKQLPIEAGGPYHPILVEDAMNAIRALYEREGYPLVAVAPRTETSADGTLIDVFLRVEEGPRRTLDRLLIRGHQRTRTAVLRRAVPLEHGIA